MKKKRFLTAWAIVSAIIVAVLLLGYYFSQNKTNLIISYGIRTANAMIVAIIAIAIVAFAISLLLFSHAYRKKYRRAPKPKPEPAPVKLDINSEAYIREKLEYFLGVRPLLHDELTECFVQMDSIKEKQASLAEVRSRNNAGFLQTVADSLDKAESSILNNMQAIINIAEIWDPREAGNPVWKTVYDERRKSVGDRIKLNNDLLMQSAKLLTKGTTFANDKTLSNAATDDLSATIEVIDQLRHMSGVTEIEK